MRGPNRWLQQLAAISVRSDNRRLCSSREAQLAPADKNGGPEFRACFPRGRKIPHVPKWMQNWAYVWPQKPPSNEGQALCAIELLGWSSFREPAHHCRRVSCRHRALGSLHKRATVSNTADSCLGAHSSFSASLSLFSSRACDI